MEGLRSTGQSRVVLFPIHLQSTYFSMAGRKRAFCLLLLGSKFLPIKEKKKKKSLILERDGRGTRVLLKRKKKKKKSRFLIFFNFVILLTFYKFINFIFLISVLNFFCLKYLHHQTELSK